MGSFKKLKSSDVITVPVIANKQWNFSCCPLPISNPYFNIYNGINITGTFSPGAEPITNNQYDRLMYTMIDQMFYHKYSGSLSTASLASSLYYEDPTGLRPTRSYFNFTDNPGFVNNFPTGINETIRVLSVSPQIYGERILPHSLGLSSSTYNFTDDGNGNIYDQGTIHIGNIFYPEGILVVTNQNYQGIFPYTPVAYDDIISIIRSDYGNPVTISLSPLTNDDLRGNTLINQSIQLFGGDIGFFSTGSNNTISMSFSSLGTGIYQTFYTFQVTGSYCSPLTSNTGSIIIAVQDPDCAFEMSIAQYEELILATANINGDQICVVLEVYTGSLP